MAEEEQSLEIAAGGRGIELACNGEISIAIACKCSVNWSPRLRKCLLRKCHIKDTGKTVAHEIKTMIMQLQRLQ